ncbi:hypothetical protein CW740_11240 [Kangiella profundi]|uniref:Uncharacterized protein n=1 Tax=Kangiella profundi TaxID=1561924 RepID=A0A2K9B4F3_9GAMM|nr:hypothetical protein [Kangiella profundi]AUD79788.1 hypothetical protein CW740_11240 [Kangiella profundi]GGE95323.1 hypothetical protein GCM10011356_06630 [Kangiella profundi]
MYKQSLIKLAIISFLAYLLYPLTAFAAEEKPPALVSMWVMDVKSGSEKEFEEAFKAHIKVRQKAGDTRSWQVYTPHTGSDFNRYIIRYCCFKWADQDDYAKWANDSKVMANWDKGAGKYVERYAHHYSWVDMENSHWKDDETYRYVGVRSYHIIPGSDISSSVKEISDLAKAIEWDRSWGWTYNVTGSNELQVAFPFKNFADMQPPEPSFGELAEKHLGSEEKVDEIFDRFSKKYSDTHYSIYRHHPELSMSNKE